MARCSASSGQIRTTPTLEGVLSPSASRSRANVHSAGPPPFVPLTASPSAPANGSSGRCRSMAGTAQTSSGPCVRRRKATGILRRT
jgi:hypothetical protein